MIFCNSLYNYDFIIKINNFHKSANKFGLIIGNSFPTVTNSVFYLVGSYSFIDYFNSFDILNGSSNIES